MSDSTPHSFCIHCGKELDPDHVYCMNCGKAQSSEIAAAAMEVPVPGDPVTPIQVTPPVPVGVPAPIVDVRPVDVEPRRSKGAKWFVLSALALVVLTVIGGGAWWYLHRPQLAAVETGLGIRSDNALRSTRSEFIWSDVIHTSVAVTNPKEGHEITVRWLKGGTEVSSEKVRVSRSRPNSRLAVFLAPEQPLEPGVYQVEASLNGGKPMSAGFKVVPAPDLQADNVQLSGDGNSTASRFESSVTALTTSGEFVNFNRFSDVHVVWERNGALVKTEKFAPTADALDDAQDRIPFTFSLDREALSYMQPGEYTVQVKDGDKVVTSKSVAVYVATKVSGLEIGEDTNNNGRVTKDSHSFFHIQYLRASVLIESAPRDTVISAEWYLNGRLQPNLSRSFTVSEDTFQQYYWAGIQNTYYITSGTWKVVIRVNGQETQSASVSVY